MKSVGSYLSLRTEALVGNVGVMSEGHMGHRFIIKVMRLILEDDLHASSIHTHGDRRRG